VLDQSPVPEGSSGTDALHNTIDLAPPLDELGYPPLLGGRAPRRSDARQREPRGADRRDRAGHSADPHRVAGGVMLPHYSPLKVAETFSVLSGLFPGRIDLGLGRAPGT